MYPTGPPIRQLCLKWLCRLRAAPGLSPSILTQNLRRRPPCVKTGTFTSSPWADQRELRYEQRARLLARFAPLEVRGCLFEYEDGIPVVFTGAEAWACDPVPRLFPTSSMLECREVTLEEFCDSVLLYDLFDAAQWVRCGDCGEAVETDSGIYADLDADLDLRVFHHDAETHRNRAVRELELMLANMS
jgi:hypothetical protein